jgi:hypothetical protein
VATGAWTLCFWLRPGVFFAMTPVPFQMVAAALFAFLVRVNIPAAAACTWVSDPLTTPLILFSQDSLGSLVLGGVATDQPKEDMLALLAQAPWPLLVGRSSWGRFSRWGLSARLGGLGLVERADPSSSKREVVKKIFRAFENALKFMHTGA